LLLQEEVKLQDRWIGPFGAGRREAEGAAGLAVLFPRPLARRAAEAGRRGSGS